MIIVISMHNRISRIFKIGLWLEIPSKIQHFKSLLFTNNRKISSEYFSYIRH